MRTRWMIVTAICGVSLLGWALGHGTGQAVAADACPADVGAADRSMGVAAVHQGRLVGLDGPIASTDAEASVPRHVATGPHGTAYVQDRPGDDAVVVSTDRGVRSLPQRGEASHPTWSAAGAIAWGVDDRLLVRSATGDQRSIAGPRPGGIVVAPVFVGRDIVAVVSAGPTAAVPEDGWSDDLWRFDGARWRRLTSFRAGADRWTAIRTPFVAADGSMEFVVVGGRASEDRPPRFSLWRLRGSEVQQVASLVGERYLAGFASDGSRLWNVPDRATETWLIQRETPYGLETVGCGAVAVDPMDAPDPDRVGHTAPAARTRPDDREAPTLDPGDPIEAALLIGDFTSQVAADVVAHQVTESYGGSLPVDVVRGGADSTIVQPDRWAVVVRLPATTDGGGELETMQARLPEYADHMWVVVP